MNTPHRARVAALSAALVLVVTAGCSDGSQFTPAPPEVPQPVPAGYQDPAEIPDVGDADSCDPGPTESYSPDDGTDDAALQEIIDRGRLRVGVDQNSFLMGYRNPSTGQLEGFDIDIAREIARDLLGDPEAIQFVAMTSAQRIPYLQDGEVDMVVRTMTMTCARWEEVAFSTEYYTAGQKLLVPTNSPIEGRDDLTADHKVCAAAESTSLARIDDAGAHTVSTRDWTDCMVLLQQGAVHAVSTDDVLLAGMSAQDPTLHVVGDTFSDEPYGVAVPGDHVAVARFVNAVLDRIRDDGTWDDIYQRWLADSLGDAEAPEPQYRD